MNKFSNFKIHRCIYSHCLINMQFRQSMFSRTSLSDWKARFCQAYFSKQAKKVFKKSQNLKTWLPKS